MLRELQPLHVEPETPVFTTTAGEPIEPKTFSEHWYAASAALGHPRARALLHEGHLRVGRAPGRCAIAWVEKQTGVAYATLKKHYAKWMPDERASELQRLEAVFASCSDGEV